MDFSMPVFPVLHYFPEFAQTHVYWVDDAIQTSHPVSPSSCSGLKFPSIRVFSNELALHSRWSKYCSFSISPSNDYSGLIFFRIDWFDLFAIQGTQKSSLTPQFKSTNSSVLSFLYGPTLTYMTTGKTIALPTWTFDGKVMSLFFNMPSMLVIAFLPKSKHLLISWTQSPFAVILEPKKRKSVSISIVSPFICHEMMGPDAIIFVFFGCWTWNQLFHCPLLLSSTVFLVALHFLPLWSRHLRIWGYWYFSLKSWFQLVLHPAWHFPWYILHIS